MLFPQNKLRPSSCGCLARTMEDVFPQSAKAPAIADLTRPISDEYQGDVSGTILRLPRSYPC